MPDHRLPDRSPAELAEDCVRLVAAIDACDDLVRLRAGFRVLALAVPDLAVSETARRAAIDTCRASLDGTWP